MRRLCPRDVPLADLPSRPLLYLRTGDGQVTEELTVLLTVESGKVNQLLTSLGNELNFQRQPRFQEVELQNLVT